MKPLIKPRKYAGGGGFGAGFMQGGGMQAIGGGMDMIDGLLDGFAKKRMIKKQEEEAARRAAFEEEVNTSAKARAGALAVLQYDRDGGSTAISSAQASLGNLPNYPGPDGPQNNTGADVASIGGSLVNAGFGVANALKKDNKKSDPPVVQSLTTADPNDASTNPAGANVDPSQADQLSGLLPKDAQTSPTGMSGYFKGLVGKKQTGGLIPRFSVHRFDGGGTVIPSAPKGRKGVKAGAAVGAIASAAMDIGNKLTTHFMNKSIQKELERLDIANANNDNLRAETDLIVKDALNGNGPDTKKLVNTTAMPTGQISPGQPKPPTVSGTPNPVNRTPNVNNLENMAGDINVTPEGQKPVVKNTPIQPDQTQVTLLVTESPSTEHLGGIINVGNPTVVNEEEIIPDENNPVTAGGNTEGNNLTITLKIVDGSEKVDASSNSETPTPTETPTPVVNSETEEDKKKKLSTSTKVAGRKFGGILKHKFEINDFYTR